jgi:uncharacterized PurR-regulated membrane protein YhhQ (DUF165 family)
MLEVQNLSMRFGGLLVNGFLFKMLIALLDTPLFYAAVWYLKPLIGDEDREE